jgi:hypothetical protein
VETQEMSAPWKKGCCVMNVRIPQLAVLLAANIFIRLSSVFIWPSFSCLIVTPGDELNSDVTPAVCPLTGCFYKFKRNYFLIKLF